MDKEYQLFKEWVENKLENIDDEFILYELKNFPDGGLSFNILDISGFCKKYNINENSLENDSVIEGIISNVASNRMNIIQLDNSVFLGPYTEDDE